MTRQSPEADAEEFARAMARILARALAAKHVEAVMRRRGNLPPLIDDGVT